MRLNDIALFEAYVSVDIENPLNADIYKLRDELADKKMTAMPVDVPLFGHFDSNMTLVRHIDMLRELMQCALKVVNAMRFDDDDYILKTDHYKVTADGHLVLVMQENRLISALLKTIVSIAEERNMSEIYSLESLKVFKKNQNIDPIIYVVMKTHLPLTEIKKYDGVKVDIEIEMKRLSLYHKEAVPLTRLLSWELN